VLNSGHADAFGVYQHTVTDLFVGGSFRLRVLSDAEAGSVGPSDGSVATWTSTDVFQAQSQTTDVSVTVDSDTSEAFNVLDAIVSGHDYVKTQLGSGAMTARVRVNFPVSGCESNGGSVSCFVGTSIELKKSEAYSDDAILHEYAHFVMRKLVPLADIDGGSHGPCSLGSESLAFSEGWAHYFAGRVRSSPHVVLYPAFGFYFDVEKNLTFFGTVNCGLQSESYEGSVAAVLWDAADGEDAEPFDDISDQGRVIQILSNWGQGSSEVHPTSAVFRDAWNDDRLDAVMCANVLTHCNTTFPVAISKGGAGGGAITSIPVGIDCGLTCNHPFRVNTRLVLAATPAPGSTFTAWSGDCAGSRRICELSVTRTLNVTATFAVASGLPSTVSIVTQPQNQTIQAGQSASLGVVVNASSAVNYQWYSGYSGDMSVPIPGAGASAYLTPPVDRTNRYWVQIIGAGGVAVDSATATVIARFTDDGLAARAAAIRSVHILELRNRIDILRTRSGLPAFPWTDPALIPGATMMRAIHVGDLRDALAAVYAATGNEQPSYGNQLLQGALIRVQDVLELRAAVLAVE
jgi:hypothetical protein